MIDNDEWGIENAKENVISNSCSKIELKLASSIPGNKQFDIILANINLNVISENIEHIYNVSKTGTIILLSGFLKQDEAKIQEILANNRLIYTNSTQKGDWITVLAEKQ